MFKYCNEVEGSHFDEFLSDFLRYIFCYVIVYFMIEFVILQLYVAFPEIICGVHIYHS